MTNRRASSKLITMLLTVLTVCSLMILPVNAATSGGENTRTISVRTYSDWSRPGSESITLRQNKCKYTYSTLKKFSLTKWETKSSSMYPYYRITIRNNTNGKTTTKTWHSASIKLPLNRNSSYTITVAYDSMQTWLSSNAKNSGCWKNSPCWWVSATHKSSAQ